MGNAARILLLLSVAAAALPFAAATRAPREPLHAAGSSGGPGGRAQRCPAADPGNARRARALPPPVAAPAAPPVSEDVPTGTVSGIVLGPAGEPFSGARVRVNVSEDDVRELVSDDEGRFHTERVPLEVVVVGARADGLDDAVNDCFRLDGEHRDAWSELRLREFAWLDLFVTAPGAPPSECFLDVAADPVSPDCSELRDEAVSLDAAGHGAIRLSREGETRMTVQVGPHPPAELTFDAVRGERRTVRVAIDEGAPLSGVVVDDRGEPVAGAEAIVVRGRRRLTATAGDDGSVRFANLAADAHELTVTGPGHRDVSLAGVRPGEVRVVLQRHGRVAVRCVTSGQLPMPERAQLCGERVDIEDTCVWNETVKPDAQSFPVESGRWHFVLSAKGFARRDFVDLVPPGGVLDLGVVTLDRGVEMRGRVTGPDGGPVAGADVWAGWRSTQTDADGRFVLEHMPQHEVEVSATADAFEVSTVRASAAGHVALTLWRGGRVRGALSATEDPAEARLTFLRDGDPVERRTMTCDSFDLRLLPGRWTVTAARGETILATREIDVSESADLEIDFGSGR